MMMIASSISAVLSYSLQIQVPAPHGVFLILPLVSKPLMWVLCILAGSGLRRGHAGMLEVRAKTGPGSATLAGGLNKELFMQLTCADILSIARSKPKDEALQRVVGRLTKPGIPRPLI